MITFNFIQPMRWNNSIVVMCFFPCPHKCALRNSLYGNRNHTTIMQLYTEAMFCLSPTTVSGILSPLFVTFSGALSIQRKT